MWSNAYAESRDENIERIGLWGILLTVQLSAAILLFFEQWIVLGILTILAVMVLRPNWITCTLMAVASFYKTCLVTELISNEIASSRIMKYFFIYFIALPLFFYALARVLAFRKSMNMRKEVEFPMLSLYVLSMVSLVWSNYTPHKYQHFGKYTILIMILYAMCHFMLTRRDIKRFLWFSVLFGIGFTAANAWSINVFNINHASGIVVKSEYLYKFYNNLIFAFNFGDIGKRAAALSPPALTALSFAFFMYFALMLIPMTRSGFAKIFLWICAFISVYGICLTRTRTALVALLCGLFVTAYGIYWKKNRFFIMATLIVSLVVAVYGLSIAEDYYKGIKRFTVALDTQKKSSLAIRFKIWSFGFRELKKNYGMGLGFGGFHKVVPTLPHSHNLYFSVLFDMGVIGLILWFWFIFVIYKLFRDKVIALGSDNPKERTILFVMAGGLVTAGMHGLMDFEFILELVWIYFGMAFAYFNIIDRLGPIDTTEKISQ